MTERGKIRNRENALQIRDFSGLRWGNITPTDNDGFIDFQNNLFIYIELKYGNKQLDYGQELAFERQCDACQRGGVPTYFIVASHWAEGDIDVANAVVTMCRYKKKWQYPKKQTTVREAIDKLRERHLRI